MAKLLKEHEPVSAYRDRRFKGTQQQFMDALLTSCTVYIGNLSFYTTEEQIYEVFSRCGEIKKIIMGLDKTNMTPCGFCFVQFYTREDTEDAVKYVNGSVIDDRAIRVDFDWGYEDGRQWGRGRSGGQVRDEYRTDFDPGRGGYGKLVQRELEMRTYIDYGSSEISIFDTDRLTFPPERAPYRGKRHIAGAGPQKSKQLYTKRRRSGPSEDDVAGGDRPTSEPRLGASKSKRVESGDTRIDESAAE